MSRLLEVDSLDVHYGPVQALRGLSIVVDEGEMVALLGANGVGKTTTLQTISGLLTPTRGAISFDGQRIDRLSAHRVAHLGIAHVPEGRDLFPALSVLDNLRAGYWVRRRAKAGLGDSLDRMMTLFPRLRERVGQAAGTLSGGEQQMLVVARALMSRPRLLLVDELSFGLAPMIVEQLFTALRVVNDEGTAVILVEQFVNKALEHTHRAYVLTKGQVEIEGPSSDLASDPTVLTAYLGGGADQGGSQPRAGRAPAEKDHGARRAGRAGRTGAAGRSGSPTTPAKAAGNGAAPVPRTQRSPRGTRRQP
ncbi:MAG: ABC transporter ATP-binding protein [Mycobacteriales bacterium]